MHLEILTNLFSAYNIAYEEYLRMRNNPADSYNSFDYTIGASYVDYKEQAKEKAKKILSTEISRCNHEKIFFRGCNFKNYEHNYINRLNAFLSEYDDSSELDFIDDEIEYYKKSFNDVLSNDFSIYKTDITNITYLNRIIEVISFKQFQISTNKIIKFLSEKVSYINNKIDIYSNRQTNIYNHESSIKSNLETDKHLEVFLESNININKLPSFNKVFFVHYQCEDFNVSDEITSLSIFAKDRAIEFKSKSEAENIEEYCNMVNNLVEQGLTPIHWSQNRPYYGAEHIMSRYYKLSGKIIEFEYKNSLNLSAVLKNKFGEEYVNHPRLDNLAIINNFNGISTKEKGLRTFDANRVLLLSKIYFGILNKTIKIGVYNTEESTEVPKKRNNDIEVIEQNSLSKIPAKYHALAYMLELLVKNETPPTKFGAFIKGDIIKIGKIRCENGGQNFYKYVKDHFINVQKKQIKNSIFKNWKEIISQITIDKENVEKYINSNNL
jgi:hypothetical protein